MQNILSRKHFELNMCYPKLETVVPNLKTAFVTLPEAFQRYSHFAGNALSSVYSHSI